KSADLENWRGKQSRRPYRPSDRPLSAGWQSARNESPACRSPEWLRMKRTLAIGPSPWDWHDDWSEKPRLRLYRVASAISERRPPRRELKSRPERFRNQRLPCEEQRSLPQLAQKCKNRLPSSGQR